MRRLLASLVMIACAQSVAFGCLNDNESPQHEREFRSQYLAPILRVKRPSGIVRSALRSRPSAALCC